MVIKILLKTINQNGISSYWHSFVRIVEWLANPHSTPSFGGTGRRDVMVDFELLNIQHQKSIIRNAGGLIL